MKSGPSKPKAKTKTKCLSPRGKKLVKPPRGQKPPAALGRDKLKNEEAKNLAHQIATLVLDKMATDVVCLDVQGMTSYADYFVVASGDSERQVAAMAAYVREKMKEKAIRPLSSDGQDNGRWVLLDFGDVVAHFFLVEARAFYDLEGLWVDAPREKFS